MRVILGSKSTGRRHVFKTFFSSLFVDEETSFMRPDIDESLIRDDDPRKMVKLIAAAKCDKILELLGAQVEKEDEIVVISCDQVVLCGSGSEEAVVREKPKDEAEARDFLESYLKHGKPAICINGIVVHSCKTGERFETVQETEVVFSTSIFSNGKDDEAIIREMIESGKTFTSAGGFIVDYPMAGRVLELRGGGVDGIKGLPIPETAELLRKAIKNEPIVVKFPEVSHVIFDLDGLILDTEGMYSEVQAQMLEPYGKIFNDEAKGLMMGRKALDGAKAMIEYYSIEDRLTPEEFVRERESRMETMFPDSKLLPGAERLIRHLHSRKIPLAIATGSQESHYKLKTSKHRELFDLFDVVITGDMVRVSKPDPEIFLRASRGLKLDKNAALVLEDSPLGVEAALKAEMKVIMIEAPYNMDSKVVPTQKLTSLLEFRPEVFGLPSF